MSTLEPSKFDNDLVNVTNMFKLIYDLVRRCCSWTYFTQRNSVHENSPVRLR